MPRTTRNRREQEQQSEDDMSDHEAEQSNPNITTGAINVVSMTDAQLTAIIAAVSRSQAETNRQMFETFLSSPHASTSAPAPVDAARQRPGNFVKCTARFDGAAQSDEALEAFIDTIEIFKECANVSDDHALRGLPMLLTGEAAVWWKGVRSSIDTWEVALQRLRGRFGAPRPAHRILREVFANEQGDERADAFVSRLRAMLCRLPYVVPEQMQIDIVYGLLDRKIRKYLPRDTICSLESLLEAARNVEESRAGVIEDPTDRKPRTSVSQSSFLLPTPSDATLLDDIAKPKRVRPRCSFCKQFGHAVEECRNRQTRYETKRREDEQSRRDTPYSAKSEPCKVGNAPSVPNTEVPSTSSGIRCYGCGQRGVVRSKCEACRVKNDVATSSMDVDFNSATVTNNPDLPMVKVTIASKVGVAILDTGATHCIASPALYNVLVDNYAHFEEIERNVSLADGTSQLRKVLSTNVDVTLYGRTIPTQFLVFPGANTRTLLGRDFITDAGVILNIAQGTWCFTDTPGNSREFTSAYVLPVNQNHQIKVSNEESTASPMNRMPPKKGEALKKGEKLLGADVEQYNVQIEHVPGRPYVTAGMLPRPSSPVRCYRCTATVDVLTRSHGHIRENRLKDPEYKPFGGRPCTDHGATADLSDRIRIPVHVKRKRFRPRQLLANPYAESYRSD
ncbi:unnamed protein product [Plutella xylostella]|uniref:(diamondback moth) hypothetical protein n=1 Tax=Plutella xylostella TaxID=51655 RepID=A0A8S4G9E5_PLUXY|nr:unnamed protein product [Plutella xylostella]